MKKNLERIAILCSIVLLGGAVVAFARHHGGPPPPGMHGGPGPGPGMNDALADRLELTEEQRARLQEITERYESGELGQRLEAFHQARERLEDRVHDPDVEEPQVLDAARAASAEAESLALVRHRMTVEINEILTDEQRQEFRKIRDERPGGPPGCPPPPGHGRRGPGR